jgi:DNA repair protein RecN (Recombination protein N)
MLAELRVENLLLIERADLRLGAGLNVLTGETGAGKTVLAHALSLLLGDRPKPSIVRPGASEAYVEGCFTVCRAFAESLPEGCVVEGLDEQGDRPLELTLGRRVLSDGRTRAYMNGRSAALGDLRAVAGELIAFHGQHEHRRLTDAAEQLEILDGLCGAAQQQRRASCAAALEQLRQARAELETLQQLQAARERELDLLQHELAEIEALDPQPGEQQQLQERRQKLRQIDALRSAALLGAQELAGDDRDLRGAAQAIASAAAHIGHLQGLDTQLDALGRRCEALAVEADDLALELGRCGEGFEAEEGELQRLEERLSEIERLARKHGGDLEAVLAFAARGSARREELLGADLAAEKARESEAAAAKDLDREVKALRRARKQAAPKLEAAMRSQLHALAMKDAHFEVRLGEREPTGSGGDVVEFMLAPNPGVAPSPLRQTASGGELSRTMLALSCVCDGAAEEAAEDDSSTTGPGPATLVFDEVDSGIGGHTARVVGQRLKELAAGRQVLCITHLPQIASLAQTHFSIVKGSTQASTSATVIRLEEQEVVGELVRMLGAAEDDDAATRHAQELLSAA